MDESYIEDIKRAKPDILLVALGNPKQEKFISMHKHDLGAAMGIGIGGTLDFIAGTQTRDPWMRREQNGCLNISDQNGWWNGITTISPDLPAFRQPVVPHAHSAQGIGR